MQNSNVVTLKGITTRRVKRRIYRYTTVKNAKTGEIIRVRKGRPKYSYFVEVKDKAGGYISRTRWGKGNYIEDVRKRFKGVIVEWNKKTGVIQRYSRKPLSRKRFQAETTIKVLFRRKVHTFTRRSDTFSKKEDARKQALERAEGHAVDELVIPYREVKKRTIKREVRYVSVSRR